MNYNDIKSNTETIQKSIRIEKELVEKIEKLAKENERDFSSQIRFMIKEYIRIKNSM